MVKRVKADVGNVKKNKGGRPKGKGLPRKKEWKTMTIKQLRDYALRSGEMPHLFLLRVSRGDRVDGHKPTFDQRVDAAKACASYFVPKMNAVAVKDMDEGFVDKQLVFDEERLKELDHNELVVFQKVFGKLLGGGDTRESKDTRDPKEAENRYTRTIDLKPS